MKKIFLLLFLLCFSFTNICFADDFIIRNGIMFGDTKNDVLSKETLTIFENDDNKILCGGKVAGFEKSIIVYYFNNDKLTDILYVFPECDSLDAFSKQYLELYTALNNKYGTPISENNSVYSLILGIRASGIKKNDADYKETTQIQHTAWVVSCDGYNVKIDLLKPYESTGYKCYIDYHPFTDEDLALAEEAYKNEQQNKYDDL